MTYRGTMQDNGEDDGVAAQRLGCRVAHDGHPKILTFVIPAFNMKSYLPRCVDSITAVGGADVEAIIVDDGSNDGTARLADALAHNAHGPTSVRVIHQQNKGHGGAVNTGIAAARGQYIKVVDADDWVDYDALVRLLGVLRAQRAQGSDVRKGIRYKESCEAEHQSLSPVDMIVTNYVYDKVNKRRKHIVNFRRVMRPGVRLGWDDLKHFGIAQYLIMHALTFRTEVLREARTRLPEHTFYVDFLYAYQPLPWVKSLMYLDVPLYHYFIGREGQSVQTDVMIRRVDQLVRVNRLMSQATPGKGSVPTGLYRYMIHFLSINSVVASVFLILSRRPTNYRIKRELWHNLSVDSPVNARSVRRQLPSRAINLPGSVGRAIIRAGYRVAEHVIGFN